MINFIRLIVLLLITTITISADSGTPSTIRVKTDANGSLVVVGYSQTTPIIQSTFINTRVKTDSNGYLQVVLTGGTFTGPFYGPTGACSAGNVTYSFTGRTSTGLFSGAASTWSLCGGGTLGLDGNTTRIKSYLPLNVVVNAANEISFFAGTGESYTTFGEASNDGIYLLWNASSNVGKLGHHASDGQIILGNSGGTLGIGATDLTISRIAADTLGLVRGLNAQKFNIYNSDNGADDELMVVGVIANNLFGLNATSAGAGAQRSLGLRVGGAGWLINVNRHFAPENPNSYDLCDATNTCRSLYLGTSLNVNNNMTVAANGQTFASLYVTAAANGYNWDGRTKLKAPADGTFRVLNDAENTNLDIALDGVKTTYESENQSVAVDGIVSLGGTSNGGLLVVFIDTDNEVCQFLIREDSSAVTEITDTGTICSTSAGTASSINVYWDAGDSRYEAENKRAGTRDLYFSIIGKN